MVNAIRRTKLAGRIVGVVLGLTALGYLGVSAERVRRVLQAARKPQSALFSHGLAALDSDAPRTWSNEHCGSCHQREYEQWKQSRHAVAGTNRNFEMEFLLPEHGRRLYCLNCHTPQNPYQKAYPSTEPPGLDDAFTAQADWLKRGVDCLSCHVRDGFVLGTTVTSKGRKAHPMRLAPELGTAEFCAGCHQFGFKIENFPDGFTDELQQSSFEEFLEVRARGEGEARCHDCHLADGDHRMRGGYSPEMLEQAVSLELSARWREDLQAVLVSVVAEGGHVGHRIPGGEVFRFLTLHTQITDAHGETMPLRRDSRDLVRKLREEVKTKDDMQDIRVVTTWPQVETMRRRSAKLEGITNLRGESLPDTRLWPGERRRFEYLMPIDPSTIDGPLRVRAEIRYHLMDEAKARDVGHSPDEVIRLIERQETLLRLNGLP